MPQSNPSPPSSGYASIMVVMDLGAEAHNRARLTADLADRFSSRLIGIAATAVAAPLYFESPVAGISSIVEIEERRLAEELARTEAEFRRIAGTRRDLEWRQSLSMPAEYILDQTRAADLVVAARPWRGEPAYESMRIDGGSLVMGAGRPVLFVPPKIDRVSARRIVIGWKDSREARRAVTDSLPFLKAADEVMVVAIETDDRAAKDVSAYLGCHAIKSRVLSRPERDRPIADELVEVARQEAADLIVCGAYGHSRAREWVLGGATNDLLDHSPLCCLMAH